jgi:ABC-type microcin C transport system permease subunit YejB
MRPESAHDLYIARRVLLMIPTLIGVSLLITALRFCR